VSPEEFEALQSSMREMVDLRNQWVHHLVEQFNLTSVDGCAQALENLQQGYEKAERFRLKLQGIGKGIVEASEQMSAIVAKPSCPWAASPWKKSPWNQPFASRLARRDARRLPKPKMEQCFSVRC
jgi:hypothetical protein